MFRTVPLSIISNFSLYTEQWYTSYSLRAGSGRNVLILLASCQQTCITYTLLNVTSPVKRRWLILGNIFEGKQCFFCGEKCLTGIPTHFGPFRQVTKSAFNEEIERWTGRRSVISRGPIRRTYKVHCRTACLGLEISLYNLNVSGGLAPQVHNNHGRDVIVTVIRITTTVQPMISLQLNVQYLLSVKILSALRWSPGRRCSVTSTSVCCNYFTFVTV